MKVESINTCPNFNGRIMVKGAWSAELVECFIKNKEVQELASGKYNIIGVMRSKKAGIHDVNHLPEDTLYRFSIAAEKETPSILDRIKSVFGKVKEVNISNTYHREEKMADYVENQISAKTIAKKLGIKF